MSDIGEVRQHIIRLANTWLYNSVEPVEDFADALLEALDVRETCFVCAHSADHDWHKPFNLTVKDWHDYKPVLIIHARPRSKQDA